MLTLIAGLVLFLGAHSVRIVADGWRARQIDRLGLKAWKLSYTAVALIGLILIVIGYGHARQMTQVLWSPPQVMHYIAALLTLPAFILLVAADVPRNAIKAKVGHPMILGVKTWAFAHLLANGTLADVVLFGSFLLWAILDFRNARRRQPVASMTIVPTARGTMMTIVIGVVAWLVFAFWLHRVLIGVAPF